MLLYVDMVLETAINLLLLL